MINGKIKSEKASTEDWAVIFEGAADGVQVSKKGMYRIIAVNAEYQVVVYDLNVTVIGVSWDVNNSFCSLGTLHVRDVRAGQGFKSITKVYWKPF